MLSLLKSNIGEGTIEMLSEQVTSSSEDGEVFVPVVRKMGSSFPAKITWSCVDGDAVFGDHYNLNEGN